MFGKEIIDEVELKRGRVEGIGFLLVKIVFIGEKRINYLKVEVFWEFVRGMWVEGYEIRMGCLIFEKFFLVIILINGVRVFEFEGVIGKRVFGIYFYGIFYNFVFMERFFNMLRVEKGFEFVKVEEWSIEEEIEKFIWVVRESVDVEYII